METPTIGRIVRYLSAEQPGVEPREYAGIINTTVAEDPTLDAQAVGLTILDPRGSYEVSGVLPAPEAPMPGCWHWPTIVNAPAAAVETPEGVAPAEPAADPATPPVEGDVPLYSVDKLPEGEWQMFRMTATTRAMRLIGPFRVETSESENEPFYCEDGYLAMDSRGYPYAIHIDEFEQTYRETSDSQVVIDGVDFEKVQAGETVVVDGFEISSVEAKTPESPEPAGEGS